MTIDASQPKRVKTDGMEAEQHSLKDQIEAERHAREQANASRTPSQRVRSVLTKIVPPGTV